MSECQHDWVTSSVEDDHGVPIVVLSCLYCDHLWLPDFEDSPPSVPWPR